MALLPYTYLLRSSLVTVVLLLVQVATSTRLNRWHEPEYTCYPPGSSINKPTAADCDRAISDLPVSRQPTDYHWDAHFGTYIYNTALTTSGDPNSILHLPRSVSAGDCRIEIRMFQHAENAYLLWDDVRQAASGLVSRCVGNGRVMASAVGPGPGGTARLGPVLISTMYTNRPQSTPSRSGPEADPDFRIEAYYPPGTRRLEI